MHSEKRTYGSFRVFAGEALFLLRRMHRIPPALRRELTPAFRERLMLTVTAVNGCRYCAWFHSRLALRSGIGPDEIALLLGGSTSGIPADETAALGYAVHWAERDAVPEPGIRREFETLYGPARAEAIELALRMIRLGNLLGNTWDAFRRRA